MSSVRVGLLSVAHYHGHFWAEAFRESAQAEFVGIWDDDRPRGEAAAARHGVGFWPDLDAMLDACDAVGITAETVQHAPLVEKHRAALRIQRYVQLHASDSPANALLRASRGAPEEYDGIAQLWWASEAELAEATASEAGRAAGAILLEDERKFIDLARSPLWLGSEHEVF